MDSPKRMGFEGYYLEEDPKGYGTVFCLCQQWISSFKDVILRHQADVILLSAYNGWPDDNVDFLRDLRFLKGIELLSTRVKDLRPLDGLQNLQMLSLSCSPTKGFDFSTLTKLENVFLLWSDLYESLYGTSTCNRINLVGYPEQDLTVWQRNSKLEDLQISSKTMRSLSGIARFDHLKRLDLFRCPRLTHLEDLSESKNISQIELDQCRGVSNLSSLSSLPRVREVIVKNCGRIESLKPLFKCSTLESLQIAGDTLILDGNFAGLRDLRQLKRVLISHHTHYSHRAEELEHK